MAESSNSIKVSITPWEEKGFSINFLHIWESVGGKQPGGQIELVHNKNQEALDFITSQQTGTISIKDEKENGQSYIFDIFITNRNYYNNFITLDFAIIPTKVDENNKTSADELERGQLFYSKPGSETYDNIEDAVNDVWPGKQDKDNVKTDIPNTLKIRRCNETGKEFLSRLLYSWKNKSIFIFSWSGLIIREYGGNIDPEINISTGLGWNQINTTPVKYNKFHNYELFSPWENENKDSKTSMGISSTPGDFSNKKPKLVSSSIYHQGYKIHKTGYDILEKNYQGNSNFTGYASIKLLNSGDMPRDWKLGDLVNYKRLDTAEGDTEPIKCIVVGNEFFYTTPGTEGKIVGPNGNPFEWTVTLWSLEEMEASEEIQNNNKNE